MSRGVGEIELLRDILPPGSWIVFGVLTQLGDIWFLSVLLVGLYWLYDRTALAVPIAYFLGGASLVIGLKEAFGLARPAQPLVLLENIPVTYHGFYEATATASGYGFPSGHAIMATIVYLSLVRALAVSTRRQRLIAAFGLIAIVALSRIALGVHYLVDVLLGIAIGLGFLATASLAHQQWETEQPTVAFGIALGLSTVTWIAVGPITETTLVFGATLGAFGAWLLVELRFSSPRAKTRREMTHRDRARWVGIVACFGGLVLLNPLDLLVGVGTALIILVPWIDLPAVTGSQTHTS